MTKIKKERGVFGEKVATDYLERKGYKILHKNFTCKLGEIDIVARDTDTVVFVEVRTHFSASYGSPAESILWKKKKKLIMLANVYIKCFHLEKENFRFDVVSIVQRKGIADINLIKDAFWEE